MWRSIHHLGDVSFPEGSEFDSLLDLDNYQEIASDTNKQSLWKEVSRLRF